MHSRNESIGASIQAERERLVNGYWSTFLPSGIPVPGFLSALPGGASLPLRLTKKMSRNSPHYRVLFALEVEHRKHPIQTIDELKKTAIQICAPGYDFRDAEALSNAVLAALRDVSYSPR